MGGGKRGRTQRRHFKQGRENVWKHSNKKIRSTDDDPPGEPNPNSKPNPSWEPFATRNPGFEEYYKEQGIVPEEEWEQFICVLQKPLPAAFRINSSGQFFRDIRAQLENDFMKSLDEEINDENEVEAIRPLPWYPENLAWHLNFSRMQLRKNQTLERFHEFLKHENEVGNITRQEAVSMVPPLFLDVLPNHRVLDMCAAPGSKTFQLLEIIHQSTTPGSVPDGLVIANDVDVQRCNLLIHQTKRMCTANLIVTNHEAQHFPNCSLVGSHLETSKEDIRRNILQFDRILCDVPCSGDGTLRKAPDIWRKWNSGMGNGLHRLQVEIAMRGIALLRVGGRMVYSTCSMNPVENEAVVAEVLRRSRGSVVILDVSSELPELVRRPGLKKWKVRDKGLWLTSFVDVPNYRRNLILPSMFSSEQSHNESPINDGVNSGTFEENIDSLSMQHKDVSSVNHESNSDDLENSMTLVDAKVPCETKEISNGSTPKENQAVDMEAEGSTFPLERCMRLLPHDQNSGAFFVAVLEKLSDVQALPHNSCGSSNKTRKVPTKKGENVVDEQKSEIMSLENVSCQQHHAVAKESSDANLLMNQPLEIETEGGEAPCPKYVCSEENDLEGAKTRDKEESGHVMPEGQKSKLQLQGKWRGVDPVVFFKDEVTVCSIRSFYGICESFPLENHLVTRNSDTDHVKRIYYISKSVQDILELNIQVGQRLKITSLGLKIFERQTSKDGALCSFRLSSEGLPLLLPYISKQIVCAPLVDFQHLLQYRVIKFADFVDADLREKSSTLLPGCCVVVLNEGNRTADTVPADASSIAIICWKGKTNISVMVSELDAKELLERLSVRFGVGAVAASSAEGVDVDLETGLMEEAEGTETMEDLDEC